MLAESKSGYILNWVIHEGKKDTLIDIVNKLVHKYQGKGFIVSMDRFYTTIDVITELTKQDFGVYGAIMKSRLFGTKTMLKLLEELGHEESTFFISKDSQIMLSCWKDSKAVTIASNIGDNNVVPIWRRLKKREKV